MKLVGWLVAIALAVVGFGERTAHAQAKNYWPIRVDAGIAGTYTPSYGRGGFGGVAELKFNVHDQIAVGARTEGAVMIGGSIGGDVTSVSMGVVAATLLKGEYYVTTSAVRPYVGLGLGMYAIVSQDITAGDPSMTSVSQAAGRYFGVAPGLGVNFGRLRLGVTYNLILGADIEVRQQIGTPQESTSSYTQSYVTFELLVRFGGGRKPAEPAPLPPGGYYNPTGPYRPPVQPTPAPGPAPQ